MGCCECIVRKLRSDQGAISRGYGSATTDIAFEPCERQCEAECCEGPVLPRRGKREQTYNTPVGRFGQACSTCIATNCGGRVHVVMLAADSSLNSAMKDLVFF